MSAIETQVGRHIRHHDVELASAIGQRLRMRSGAAGPSEDEHSGEKVLELISHLAQALSVSEPVLLVEHVRELVRGAVGRGRDIGPIRLILETVDEVLRALLSAAHWGVARLYLGLALESLAGPAAEEDPDLSPGARRYLASILERNRTAARAVIADAARDGATVADAYMEILQPAQRHVGRLWRTGRVSVALEHYCTAISLSAMSQLMDRAPAPERKRRAFVGMSVAGENHDLGLRMVTDLLELDGWDVCFLGAATPHDAAMSEIVHCGAVVAGISATVLTHVDRAADLVRAIRLEPRCAEVKILAGGRPFELAPGLWEKIGADATAVDARQAVVEANRLAGGG